MCVCVCARMRERERERSCVHLLEEDLYNFRSVFIILFKTENELIHISKVIMLKVKMYLFTCKYSLMYNLLSNQILLS